MAPSWWAIGAVLMDIFCHRINNALYPAHDSDLEALKKIKAGETVRLNMKRVRNYQFHKKYFALLNYAFDVWDPPDVDVPVYLRDAIPEKNFDRFRRDIIILAGFYETTVRLNGDVRVEAKSISFANMSEDEFEQLYDKTIDVIVKHCLRNYSGDELRSIVEQVEGYE